MKNKKTAIYWYISIPLSVLCLVNITLFVIDYLSIYKKNVPEKFILYIPPEMTYNALLDTLKTKLLDINSFEKTARKEKLAGNLKPGRYQFEAGTYNKNMVRALVKGWQKPLMLTLSGNIRGKEKLAGILGKKLMYDSTAFITWFNQPDTWKAYGLNEETFISLFLPNTYEMYWTISPEQFLKRMKKENDAFWNTERLQKAKALGMSKEEVSTLASIVCEESNYGPELATIAGVYINRLKKGMKLDADPTVKFAVNDPSIRRILYRHLEVESPYNTYKYPGLPPGPITIPGIAGIEAVLNYQQHNYLYFCANANLDGTHKFATNLADHNKNARAYQAAVSFSGQRGS